MPFDSILFDFDGVLVDSEPIHYDCWMEVLSPFGLRVNWETYARTCVGVSDRAMLQRFAAENPTPLDVEELYAQYPRKKELFRERMIAAHPFPAETLELIPLLAARELKMAVVSSSGRTEVEPPIIHAGIRHHFETLVCGLEAGKLKPEPDPYLRAASLVNARKPLVIEDSDAGAAAGRAAGFEVLRIAHPNDLTTAVKRILGM